MGEVHIKINNHFVTAEEGDTILEAANKSGIQIPTLCYLKNVIRSGLSGRGQRGQGPAVRLHHACFRRHGSLDQL